MVPGLFGARLRAPTSRRSRPAPSARATTTSSTARRPGRRSAQYADMIFCLVRTDPTARSRRASASCSSTCTRPASPCGRSSRSTSEHEVNEVFFDNVQGAGREPASARRTRAGPTRSTCSATSAPASPASARPSASCALLKDFAATQLEGRQADRRGSAVSREDRAGRDRPDGARDDAAPRALERATSPAPEASILKIKGTEVQQALTELMMEALGPYAVPFSPEAIEAGGRATAFAPDARRAARGALLQLAQDLDLRRVERDPAQHHRADGARALESWTSISPKSSSCSRDSIARLVRERVRFRGAQAKIAGPKRLERRGVWAQFADMGLLGVPFAEAHGGFGGSMVDVMVVMQELGRGIVVEPYLSTVVIGGGLGEPRGERGAEAGHPAARRRRRSGCLPPRTASRSRATTCTTSPRRRRRDGGGYVLERPRKSVVLHGGTADTLVVSARTAGGQRDRQGITLFLVDAKGRGRDAERRAHGRRPARGGRRPRRRARRRGGGARRRSTAGSPRSRPRPTSARPRSAPRRSA